jgi:hypothetical protein
MLLFALSRRRRFESVRCLLCGVFSRFFYVRVFSEDASQGCICLARASEIEHDRDRYFFEKERRLTKKKKKKNNGREKDIRRAEEEEEEGERRGREGSCGGYGAVEAWADQDMDGIGGAS